LSAGEWVLNSSGGHAATPTDRRNSLCSASSSAWTRRYSERNASHSERSPTGRPDSGGGSEGSRISSGFAETNLAQGQSASSTAGKPVTLSVQIRSGRTSSQISISRSWECRAPATSASQIGFVTVSCCSIVGRRNSGAVTRMNSAQGSAVGSAASSAGAIRISRSSNPRASRTPVNDSSTTKTTRWPRSRSTSPSATQLLVGPHAPGSGKNTMVLPPADVMARANVSAAGRVPSADFGSIQELHSLNAPGRRRARTRTRGDRRMSLTIGDTAPDFEAQTTEGTIKFHEWIGDSWAVLFSHPKDFTPVCTTELGYMAKIKPEFDRRNVKIIGLSVDPTDNHSKWAEDIEETQGHAPNYPIIGDADFNVSKLYGMLPTSVSGEAADRTAVDNQTVRNVFVVGPDKKVKLVLVYPMTTGRNFDEVIRVIDSLQLTATHKVSTPVNWKRGEDVIIAGSVSDEEARETYPEGWESPRPYIRIVPAPDTSVVASS
jgi:alkyl hydroperoxide reductase subunit AhpC